MWFKNTCVIKKIVINDADSLRSDPDVLKHIEKATEQLGNKGRFVIRLSGIPYENSVLVEGRNKKICNKFITDFEKLLIDKGYMECEHDWVKIDETDYGEMDYSTYGGSVDHFIVSTYQCRICGELRKESTGDCNGDPGEYL